MNQTVEGLSVRDFLFEAPSDQIAKMKMIGDDVAHEFQATWSTELEKELLPSLRSEVCWMPEGNNVCVFLDSLEFIAHVEVHVDCF